MRVKLTKSTFSKELKKDIRKMLSAAKRGDLMLVKEYWDSLDIKSKVNGVIDNGFLMGSELVPIENIIITAKIMYSNDDNIMKDKKFDELLNIFKMYRKEPIVEYLKVEKRTREVKHKCPELKGTLDKANVFEIKEKITSFDKAVETYVIKWFDANGGLPLRLKFSKKYDGVSGIVETDDTGEVVYEMLSRGEDGKGSDLTHVTKNLVFDPVEHKKHFVKFEILISYTNMFKFAEKRHKTYKNARGCVTGILSSSDAEKYSKYLTFVPLQSTILAPDQCEDLNDSYENGISYDYTIVDASSPKEALKALKKYAKEVSDERDDLDYQIDGIVISCLNEKVRHILGRENDINRYEVAYKFPPIEKITQARAVELTVGRTGKITPMLEYDQVKFNGTEHHHSSIGSFERYKELDLFYGEFIKVTYNNDVMAYPDKYDCKENNIPESEKEYLTFDEHCPSCGSKLVKDGANYFCVNDFCHEKIIAQIKFFYKTLGLNYFSDESIDKFLVEGVITDFYDVLNPKYKKILNIDGCTENTVKRLKKEIKKIKEHEITPARFVKAVGICGETIADGIFEYFSFEDVFKDVNIIYTKDIPKIKQKTLDKFKDGFVKYKDVMKELIKELNVQVSKKEYTIVVAFTGFRNKDYAKELDSIGVKVKDSYAKSIDFLVMKELPKNAGEESTSYKKAIKNGTPVITVSGLNGIIETNFGVNVQTPVL